MVIGYDAKWTLESKGGLGHYGKLAIEALANFDSHNHYILYTPSADEGTTLINNLLVHACVHLKTPHSDFFKESWRTGKGILHDCHRHHVQLFHGLNGQLPDGIENDRIYSLVTIGALSFLHYPENYSFFERRRLEKDTKKACKMANRILVYSEFGKKELMQEFGVPADKIAVIFPSCETHFHENFSPQAAEMVKDKYNLPHHYILVSGDFDVRHNLLNVMKALIAHKELDFDIVVQGHHGKYYEKLKSFMESNNMLDRLVRVSKIHEQDLPVLYGEADLVVCPSLYEWTSLSMVRAFSCGVPVVAAKGSCFEEYGSDAALYFDPENPEDIAQAIITATGIKRNSLIEAGARRNQLFLPDMYAKQLNDLYREIIEDDDE